MIKQENSGLLKVNISKKELYKICYWTTLKFKNDTNHYQKVGSKNENIGCFYDHWIEKLPEEIVIKEMLKDEEFTTTEDYFIYGQDTNKNCPDVIGLRKNNHIYPLTLYNDGNWEMVNKSPFIEVKTFKKNHKLITISKSQLDDEKFYPIVISHLQPDYMLHLFNDDFFNEKIFNELKTENEFIKSNKKLIIPKKIEPPKDIGHYELLGVYKGSDLKKLSIETKDNVIYLDSIEKRKIKEKETTELNEGLYYHEHKLKSIPFCIKKENENSKIIRKNKMKTFIEIAVIGEVIVDNHILKDGTYRLTFKTFNKSNDNPEYILSKMHC